MSTTKSNISPNDSPVSKTDITEDLPISTMELRKFKGFEQISDSDGIKMITELYQLCDVIYDINKRSENE